MNRTSEGLICMACGHRIDEDELDPMYKGVDFGEGTCRVYYKVWCPECEHLFTKVVCYDYAESYYDEY